MKRWYPERFSKKASAAPPGPGRSSPLRPGCSDGVGEPAKDLFFPGPRVELFFFFRRTQGMQEDARTMTLEVWFGILDLIGEVQRSLTNLQ